MEQKVCVPQSDENILSGSVIIIEKEDLVPID